MLNMRSNNGRFMFATNGWILVAILLGLACDKQRSLGHEHHEPTPVPDAVIHRPTSIPDRIVLTWLGEPSTTQAVTWRTDDRVTRPLAELAVAHAGPDLSGVARELIGTYHALPTPLGWTAHYHTVNFTDLLPNTKYVYRVGDGVNWSEWSHFTTAKQDESEFTFVYFGDAQNDLKSRWSRVIREAYRDAPRAAFFLHAGDLVNRANRDAEWGDWHYAGGFIHRSTPCIATPGNHEYDDDALSKYWQPGFAFPNNGPDGLKESVYWIDYQCARLISLNSNERVKDQINWLEDVLKQNQKPWTILTFHHPMYSSAQGRDNPELRALWMPLFDKYKVDLVLQGHDHTYARSRLLTVENVATGVNIQKKEAGTMYVVSVSGPKMYSLGGRPFVRRAAENTQLYQIVHVGPERLKYEARTATGEKYDGFTLIKRPGMHNQLVEQVPDTPERKKDKSP